MFSVTSNPEVERVVKSIYDKLVSCYGNGNIETVPHMAKFLLGLKGMKTLVNIAEGWFLAKSNIAETAYQNLADFKIFIEGIDKIPQEVIDNKLPFLIFG